MAFVEMLTAVISVPARRGSRGGWGSTL